MMANERWLRIKLVAAYQRSGSIGSMVTPRRAR